MPKSRLTLLPAVLGLSTVAAVVRGEAVYVDNTAAAFNVAWSTSTSTPGYFGLNYNHNNQVAGRTATYTPDLPTAGTWDVWTRWSADASRSNNVPYTVNYDGGSETVYVNQRLNGNTWQKLGTWDFAAGTGSSVFLDTTGTSGFVIADAVVFSNTSGVFRQAITPAAAFASTTINTGSRGASRVIDNSGMDFVIEPMHFGTNNGESVNWMSAEFDTTGWLKVDLGSTHLLESMDVYNFSASNNSTSRGVKTFDLYVSTEADPTDNDFANNPQWTLVSSNLLLDQADQGTNFTPDLINFAPGGTQARWVAFDITSNYGNNYTGLGEVRFYAVPEPTGLIGLAGVVLVGLARRRRSAPRA